MVNLLGNQLQYMVCRGNDSLIRFLDGLNPQDQESRGCNPPPAALVSQMSCSADWYHHAGQPRACDPERRQGGLCLC